MSAGYTPGPWAVEDPMGDAQGDALWIVREGASPAVYDWRCVAIVTSDDPGEMDGSNSAPILTPERDANSRLIAAAPESHEANREAVDFLRSYFGPVASDNLAAWSDDDARQVCEKLEAAIAKARGEGDQS